MKTPFKSTQSWKVDHSYDNGAFRNSVASDGTVSTIYGGTDAPSYAEDPLSLFETAEEKKNRKRSHMVVYMTMFVMAIGFSIVISGVWPYLSALEEGIDKTFLGWVIAANPLGQFIASPLAGLIANKLGSIRVVCYFTMTTFILGNLLYSFLPFTMGWWHHSAFHMMMLARFVTGLSSSNATVCRSYLASSTTMKERTTGISIISACQSLGFVIGPAIQAILSLAIQSDSKYLKYRACGWVGAILGCINLFLLTPFIFQEYNIAEKERTLLREKSGAEKDYKLPKLDYLGIGGILFGFFINMFVYVLLESLLEPFCADQFAWCNDFAVIIVGATLSMAGILAVPMFIAATRLAKKYDERFILMLGGFVPISIGLFIMLPWGPGEVLPCWANSVTEMPPMNSTTGYSTGFTTDMYSSTERFIIVEENDILPIVFPYLDNIADSNNTYNASEICSDDHCRGCPVETQSWCLDYPQIPKAQFFIGFFIVCMGYPYGVSMSNAIFSKMLGPKPQGLWMGYLTSSGSLARITGPIFVSYIYTNLGSRYLFTILIAMMFIAIGELSLLFTRIVPMKVPDLLENNGKS